MARGINVIVAFFACATAASAVLAPFPHGKTTVYRYHTVVTTSTGDDNLYSSQFVLQGTLDVTHDTRDPELVNAYNVVLSNVSTDMHNGETVNYDGKPVIQSIDSAARVIQEPFLIIYNTNGTFEAVKIYENEPEWSKNMKMAMATTLQLDLPNINVENLSKEPHSFVSQEKTIYGDCSVTYNVHPKDRVDSNIPEQFRINKTFSPMDCVGFTAKQFNNVDNENCKVNNNQRMWTESTRDCEIEKQGEKILIKKLISNSTVYVFSPNGASYPHYIDTNTTFEFLRVKEKSEDVTPLGNFVDSPIIRDMTYRKPQGSYVPNAGVDITQGRHIVDLKSIPSQLEKLLLEAISYIEENHLDWNEINFHRTQTINKIRHTMSYMDVDALQVTFDIFVNQFHSRAMAIKNIFLGVVSQVGTPASCIFTRNVILKNNISDSMAIRMLSRLSLSVKTPTTQLLTQMEDLAKFNDPISAEVRKAGILSFASLIYRTFKHSSHPEDITILNKYVHDFFNHVKNEPTDEMKVVYLMAMKNIQVGKIYDLLGPIITGDLVISEDPKHIQLLAIWAIDKAVEEDYTIAHRILWPVMVNETLPTKVRIAAYEILINQVPDQDSAIKVHQYVSSEGNANFYNYHYTNLDNIAKSTDQCKVNIRTIARSILKTIEYPPKSHENIHYPLSDVQSFGYNDNTFFNAEKFEVGTIVDEFTGVPEVLRFEHIVMDDNGAISDFAIQMHIEGYHELMAVLSDVGPIRSITFTTIRDLLEEAARLLPAMKKVHIDIVIMCSGRVLLANHYNRNNLKQVNRDVWEEISDMSVEFDINYQSVVFSRLYEKELNSDIGLPVILENRVPIVTSLKMNYNVATFSPSKFELEVELKTWKHGDYSMSVYNPMKDVWHAVRSLTATEVSLPFRSTISFDDYPLALNFSFPERPGTISPAAGILVMGKHVVSVDEEDTSALMESCPTCHHQVEVRDGSREGNFNETYDRIYDSQHTGLKFSHSIRLCDYGHMSELVLGHMPVWDRNFTSNVSDSWSDVFVQAVIYIMSEVNKEILDMQLRSCGSIFKIEPSTNYARSGIDFKLNGRSDDLERNEKIHDSAHTEKYIFNATVDMISSFTNATDDFWNFEFDVDTSRDNSANKASIKITRKTPEEEDLKVCIDFKKNYPAVPTDYLKLDETNDEIDSKLIIACGYTNEEECVRNQSLISWTWKAQLSDEQKMRLKQDMKNSACSQDRNNPLFASSKKLVPRTINCLNDAIRYTTPRKYTVDIRHQQLSEDFAGFIYHSFTDHREPRESENINFGAEFRMETNDIDFQWMTNTSDITKTNFPLEKLRDYGHGPVLNSPWELPFDNTRFRLKFLHDYTENDIRICSIYPQIVLTDDGINMPFTIPSDEWTLITGDHVHKEFAIFAKQPRPNNLSFLIFVKDHGVHIVTRESDDVLVAITEGVGTATEESLTLPLGEDYYWKLKVTKRNDEFVVNFNKISLTLFVGRNYMSIVFDSELQGRISGLCGHLNGNSHNGNPEIFSIKDIKGY